MRLALKHKKDLSQLISVTDAVSLRQGLSVGAVWLIFDLAKQLGITEALGHSRQGKLALWQVIARVIDQGSRLSAVRLAAAMGRVIFWDWKRLTRMTYMRISIGLMRTRQKSKIVFLNSPTLARNRGCICRM